MKTAHEFNRIVEIQVGRKIVTTLVRFKAYINDITYVEERLDDKGKAYSNVCTINHRERGEMFVTGSYEELAPLIFKEEANHEVKKVGFQMPVKDEDIRPKRRKGNSKRRDSGDT